MDKRLRVLVTGGAGFIGSNQRLFCDEERVGKLVVPNLIRDLLTEHECVKMY